MPNYSKNVVGHGESVSSWRTQTYAPNAIASSSLLDSTKATKSMGGTQEKNTIFLQDLDLMDSVIKRTF
jgi:hypothetical protein